MNSSFIWFIAIIYQVNSLENWIDLIDYYEANAEINS